MASVTRNIAVLDGIELPQESTDQERAQMISAAKRLLKRLEVPTERYASICLMPFVFGAQNTLIDMGILDKWQADGGSAQKVEDLAKLAGADPVLLERLLRLLAAEHIVDQTAPLTYQMNNFTRGLLSEDFKGLNQFTKAVFTPAALHMPEYLASLEYKNPSDPDNACFMETTNANRGTHLFPWLMAQPELAKAYSQTVAVLAEQTWWVDHYPVEEILPKDATGKEVTIVDIGGGFGDDLDRFRSQFEGRHGRLILQDLAHVIGMTKCKAPIETTVHDFFTPQIITGARVYCLRSVLHDWPFEKAKEILRNQVPAMRPGYSKILIHERIIPDTEALFYTLLFDMVMMTLGSAIERTKSQWEELITAAGLKIVRIWPMPVKSEVIIECEIA